ncbi:MAG: stage V sporulation protein D [Selenomonadales bacterium]|nr:stage V sporulation protein D [Selenomonadales bacterium]
MSTPKSFRTRAGLLLAVFVVALFGLVLRLGFLQFVRGPMLTRLAIAQWMRDAPVDPRRGVIYDRQGRELAISADVDSIVASPARITEPRETAKKLAAVLGLAEDTIYELLTRRQSRVYVARRVTEAQAAAVRALALPGIHFDIETARFYPFGTLASHVLGFAGRDGQGLDGVELTYDSILRGTAGKVRTPTDNKGNPLPNAYPEYVPPVDGRSIVLTIDEVIQHIVERELDIAMAKHQAQAALAVAMNPRTGEILAMANRPTYDPNRFNLYPVELRRNAAVSDSFEPGSTFKLVTAAAALNEDLVRETDRFYCPGYVVVAGVRLSCWRTRGHGSLNFSQVMDLSCNPGFVNVGQKLGQEALFRYIAEFGFGRRTGVDLPGEATGIMFRQVGPVELATTSFGQGPAVTPLQQVVAISAIANDGRRMRPRLVNQIKDNHGNGVETFAPEEVARPVTAETARRLQALLESAVVHGSGRNAFIEGYRVAGKTGTAQVPRPGGGYFPDRYIASFIGFAPADDPQVALLVMVRDPRGPYGYYGSQVAAPAFRAMMVDILRYLRVQPAPTAASELQPNPIVVPELRGLTTTAAVAHLRDLGLNLRIEQAGVQIVDQTPKPGAQVAAGTTVIVSLGEPPVLGTTAVVPDVRGMTMRDASLRIESLGLRIIIEGTGTANAQDPLPGTQVALGTGVRVRFSP